MSIAGFFEKARAIVERTIPAKTQHDFALKALHMKLSQQRTPRPKRNLHYVSASKVGELEHRLPPKNGVVRTVKVPLLHKLRIDASRYPFAHSNGGQHPDWITSKGCSYEQW